MGGSFARGNLKREPNLISLAGKGRESPAESSNLKGLVPRAHGCVSSMPRNGGQRSSTGRSPPRDGGLDGVKRVKVLAYRNIVQKLMMLMRPQTAWKVGYASRSPLATLKIFHRSPRSIASLVVRLILPDYSLCAIREAPARSEVMVTRESFNIRPVWGNIGNTKPVASSSRSCLLNVGGCVSRTAPPQVGICVT